MRRWTKDLFEKLLLVDQVAINRGRTGLQFAPEYSNSAYTTMLRREVSVGDYFSLNTCVFGDMARTGARETMVLLIEELHSTKGYRELTLYQAVNIADRYFCELAKNGLPPPSVVAVGVVALLLAAKVGESISPNFKNMVKLIDQK